MKTVWTLLAAAAVVTSGASIAQTRGKGGTMINEALAMPKCDTPIGTVALVEAKKQNNASGQVSPGLEALMNLARAQQGFSTARADPIALLKVITAQSGCFQVVDRGEGFDALQRERALASGGQVNGAAPSATIAAADYLLTAEVVYQDENAGSRGGVLGGLGGGIAGLTGLNQKKIESQTMLTIVEVATGRQAAIATGSARKRDLKFAGGGLVGLGFGLFGKESTDVSKVTVAALVDAFAKLVPQVLAVRTRNASSLAVPPAGRAPVIAPSTVAVLPVPSGR